ncbi:MAG: hypothetical protein AAFY76_25785, partial [Cyanobacteria bacterium J06649_11]
DESKFTESTTPTMRDISESPTTINHDTNIVQQQQQDNPKIETFVEGVDFIKDDISSQNPHNDDEETEALGNSEQSVLSGMIGGTEEILNESSSKLIDRDGTKESEHDNLEHQPYKKSSLDNGNDDFSTMRSSNEDLSSSVNDGKSPPNHVDSQGGHLVNLGENRNKDDSSDSFIDKKELLENVEDAQENYSHNGNENEPMKGYTQQSDDRIDGNIVDDTGPVHYGGLPIKGGVNDDGDQGETTRIDVLEKVKFPKFDKKLKLTKLFIFVFYQTYLNTFLSTCKISNFPLFSYLELELLND